MRHQIDALTSLRGIAAILVVLYHYSGGFLPNLDAGEKTHFIIKGYLWVDMFFLLSGFIMMLSYGQAFSARIEWRSFKPFLFARLARLYPLHLVVLAGFVALEIVRGILMDGGADLRRDPFEAERNVTALAEHLVMLHAVGLQDGLTWNGPAWSIGAEWVAYLLFPLVALLLIRLDARWWIVVGIGAMAALALISDGGRDLDVTHDFGVVRCLAQFALGAVLYLVFRDGRFGWLHRDTVFVVLALILTGMLHVGARDIFVPPVLGLLLLSLAGNKGHVGNALSVAPLRFVGEISYAIYMCHMLVLEALELVSRAGWQHPFGDRFDAGQSLLVLGLLLPLIVLIATLLYRLVEMPARRVLKESRFARTYVYGTG